MHVCWTVMTHTPILISQVPKGVLYPMSTVNLAFDRETIGPAMYFGLR